MSPHPGELVSPHRPAASPQTVRTPRGERDHEPGDGVLNTCIITLLDIYSPIFPSLFEAAAMTVVDEGGVARLQPWGNFM